MTLTSFLVKVFLTVQFMCYSSVNGCLRVRLSSNRTPELNREFTQISIESIINTTSRSGRAFYSTPVGESETVPLYLYHSIFRGDNFDVGSWVINTELSNGNNAIAFIDSWAVTPYLTGEVVDDDVTTKSWRTFHDDSWSIDESLKVECLDEHESTIYFDSDPEIALDLSGFFVLRASDEQANPVYSKIKNFEAENELFLFKMDDKWVIGETVGEDACVAYTESSENSPAFLGGIEWKYVDPRENAESTFVIAPGYVLSRNQSDNGEVVVAQTIYAALRFHRSIQYIPQGQKYFTLRNGFPMPTMGLGTGGLRGGEETVNTITTAMQLGYRLFDMAREYGNEHVIPDILTNTAEDPEMPKRGDIFIETKVWPTELGFLPTSVAIDYSLRTLKTNYVDLYMLHWPSCNENIDWMHCDTAVEPGATWQQSWMAFQKAYAEGRIMSLGASNFDLNLLQEFDAPDFLVKPHVLQNWAEPGNMDDQVLQWCSEHQVPYQPYASLRNLHQLSGRTSQDVTASLRRIAEERQVSEHKVALRFVLQAGLAPIPRSSNPEHLKENLEAFEWELTDEEMKQLWGGSLVEEL